MIDRLTNHYSFTNPATVHDEEALTTLELVGRTTAKVNEMVEEVNTLPDKVTKEVQEQIDNGTFDTQIDIYAGELSKQIVNSENRMESMVKASEERTKTNYNELDSRIDNLMEIPPGSTTMDAELMDGRVWWNGNTDASLGSAIRGQIENIRRDYFQTVGSLGYTSWHNMFTFTIEVKRNDTHYLKVDFTDNIGVYYKGSKIEATFTPENTAELGDDVEITSEKVATIYIPTYRHLVYNQFDGLFHFRIGANYQDGDICLIKTGYAYPVGGTLFDEWCIRNVVNNKNKIDAISNTPQFYGDGIVENFAGKLNNTGSVEKFLFFTDPHLCEGEGWESQFTIYKNALKKYYSASPVDFAICGGDWLGNSDLQEEACYKLGFIDKQMKEVFGRYYPVLGNHDTNYQGKLTEDGENNVGQLTDNTIKNLWFNEYETKYYSFMGQKTRFYVFDTGIDWTATLGDYENTQCGWFIDNLKANKDDNIVIVLHIFYNTSDMTIHPFSRKLTEIANAYNTRGSVILNGTTHSFSGVNNGKVRFVLSGHLHADHVTSVNNIPVIVTTETRAGGTPTFDLCLIDYQNNKLELVRVGSGDNRTITI